ncbi:MAG: phosphatase PAP2 family protein [Betaproteobacteria bacterium]
MLDPFALAVGTGLVASTPAGKALVYGLEWVPSEWRRWTEWLLVTAAVALAVLFDRLSRTSGEHDVLVFLIAALPGAVTFLVWRTAAASVLVSLLPLYYAVGALVADRTLHVPAVALDAALPLQPSWMLVYGSHYAFVFLPLLVVRQEPLLRRTMWAYVMAFLVAYAGFFAYPTVTPHPATVAGDGFATWCLRLQYRLDSPYNCFPSLHVAHSFLAALACYRVNRKVGLVAASWAALIGVSTLYTKQHYLVDVIAGVVLASIAYVLFLRGYPRHAIAERDQRLAPFRATAMIAIFGIIAVFFWSLYRSGSIVV